MLSNQEQVAMSLTSISPAKYRADIDGLRAIAVLAVLFFHAGMGFPGGYVGVDVFFVISGYLITGLILKDLDGDRFHILEFWERRVRRILPALALVVFSSLVAGWFLFLSHDFKDLGKSAIAQAMLVSNFFFWKGSGYFAQTAQVKPLLHTWSLAVEEQFYLLFPLFLMAIKGCSRRFLIPAIIIFFTASFSLSAYWSYQNPNANFYLLPSRAWELFVGSFLAAIPARRAASRWVAESLSWSGLLAILWAVFRYGHDTRFPGVAALLPCAGAALIIWANGQTVTSVGKILAVPPVVFVGLISYSLYLWHWPVLIFSEYWMIGKPPVSNRTMYLVASLVLAVLSWRFVETPFRKRSVFKGRAQIFAFAISMTVLFVLSGLAIYKMEGLPSRIPESVRRFAEGRTDRLIEHDLSLREAQNGEFPELGVGDKHQPVSLLVWGDSHAMATMPVLDALCRENSIRGVKATHTSTAPLAGYESRGRYSLNAESLAFGDAIVQFICREHVRDVVLVANWGRYLPPDGGTDLLHRGVLATISALKGSGARIWIMKQVPAHRWDVPKRLAAAVFHGEDPEKLGLPLEAHREEARLQDPIFAGISEPGVTILDPTDYFVIHTDLCRVAEGGKALYFDDDHLSIHGAMMLRPLFQPIFGTLKTQH